MMHWFSEAIGSYLCYYNAGGFWFHVEQFTEYVNARMEVWAYSKVK